MWGEGVRGMCVGGGGKGYVWGGGGVSGVCRHRQDIARHRCVTTRPKGQVTMPPT